MVEGKESVLYALPFCAGTVTGIFLCGSGIISPAAPYAAASVSMCAGSGAAALLAVCRDRLGDRMKYCIMAAAVFFCGLFCWSNHSIIGLSSGGDAPTMAERITAPAAAWLKSGIDSLPLEDRGSNALIKALVTGDKSDVPPSTAKAFRDSGASHILALSGMHLAVIYLVLTKILAVFGHTWKLRRVRFFLIIISTLFYSVMTGSSPSIVRAFLFILLRETAILTGRKANPANILCFSLTIQGALSPPVMTSASFQLSYLAMCGIYFLYPALSGIYPAGVPVLKKVWDSAAMSIACQAFTGPLAWLLFGSAPLYFIITNMIAVPLTSALMPAALAAVFLDSLGWCPDFVFTGMDRCCRLVVWCLEVICSLPGP